MGGKKFELPTPGLPKPKSVAARSRRTFVYSGDFTAEIKAMKNPRDIVRDLRPELVMDEDAKAAEKASLPDAARQTRFRPRHAPKSTPLIRTPRTPRTPRMPGGLDPDVRFPDWVQGADSDNGPRRELVVIVGVDGSGKSKWARDVLSKTHAVLEPELLIHKSPDYDPNDPDVWGDFEWAEEKNLELTIQLLKDGGCFALPTTGKSLEMLEEIIAVAREEKYHLRLIHLDVPLAIAKRWNEQRVREVDSGTLEEQAARMPTVVRELSGLFDDVDVVGGLGSFFLGNGASKAV